MTDQTKNSLYSWKLFIVHLLIHDPFICSRMNVKWINSWIIERLAFKKCPCLAAIFGLKI